MEILIVAATEMEISPIVNENLKADILITGVGVPATMYHLHKKIQHSGYGLIIQAGICGSFSQQNKLGKCLAVKADTFADIGIFEQGGFFSVFDMGFALKDNFPFKNSWLVNEHSLIDKIELEKVNGITVNSVGENSSHTNLLIKKYPAEIESMEGAAFHYVCLQEKIPFLQLRATSNFVGERDKAKWKMKEAVLNLNNELRKILSQLY